MTCGRAWHMLPGDYFVCCVMQAGFCGSCHQTEDINHKGSASLRNASSDTRSPPGKAQDPIQAGRRLGKVVRQDSSRAFCLLKNEEIMGIYRRQPILTAVKLTRHCRHIVA